MKIKLFFITFLVSISAFSQEKKVNIYPFKSAIIEYEYEASFSGTHIKYIDDYGYKQADYIRRELNYNGSTEKEYETIILIGEKAYTINWQDSTVAVGRNETYTYFLQHPDISGSDISEAILKTTYGNSPIGTEIYLKKECKLWQSGKSKMLSWEGIMLKSETNIFMMMVEKAVKIKLNKKIKNEMFDIPSGLKYISTDVYQGYAGLELSFEDTSTNTKSSTAFKVNFNSARLAGCNNFLYYNLEGELIAGTGVNDYNKIDYKLIKSQQYAMTDDKVELVRGSVLMFITTTGDFGKMQVFQDD